jgi:hypothetical protein
MGLGVWGGGRAGGLSDCNLYVVIEILRYVTPTGKDVFGEWFAKVKDARTKARIANRIDRVALGNFGDCKMLGEGVWELRSIGGQVIAFTSRCSQRLSC